MTPYRVTLEYHQHDGPPTQAASAHLLSRLRAAAPDGDVAIELGIGRFHAGLTVEANNPGDAVNAAVSTSRTVFARTAARIDVTPSGREDQHG